MLLGGLGGLFYFLFIYGNIWNCADPIWHETGHKTAFKSIFGITFFIR